MPTDEVAAVHRLLDAFNRGDFSALNELDPAAELQDEPRIPGAGWNYGHDGAVKWAVKLWQSFGRLSFAIDTGVRSRTSRPPKRISPIAIVSRAFTPDTTLPM